MSAAIRWYVARRLGQVMVVLLLVSIVVFLIARLSGNPADVMLPPDTPPDIRQAVIHEFGLDQPLPVQYGQYVSNALQGDFGYSVRFQAPAMQLVMERMPATIQLAAAALVFAVAVGVPLGVLAALRRGRAADYVANTLLALGQAAPSFWVGIMLILVFGVTLRWLPFIGNQSLASLVLPAITLGLVPLVTIARVTRSSMVGVLSQDYIRTAKAKGLRLHSVLSRHMMRNGLIPVITVSGILTGELLGGAVLTEQIFSWPGIGALAIEAIQARDYAVVQAVTLTAATIVVLLNVVVDFSYFAIDPQIRPSAVRS